MLLFVVLVPQNEHHQFFRVFGWLQVLGMSVELTGVGYLRRTYRGVLPKNTGVK